LSTLGPLTAEANAVFRSEFLLVTDKLNGLTQHSLRYVISEIIINNPQIAFLNYGT
jgi:hypothetical protein